MPRPRRPWGSASGRLRALLWGASWGRQLLPRLLLHVAQLGLLLQDCAVHRQFVILVVLLVGRAFGGDVLLLEQCAQRLDCSRFAAPLAQERLPGSEELSHFYFQPTGVV